MAVPHGRASLTRTVEGMPLPASSQAAAVLPSASTKDARRPSMAADGGEPLMFVSLSRATLTLCRRQRPRIASRATITPRTLGIASMVLYTNRRNDCGPGHPPRSSLDQANVRILPQRVLHLNRRVAAICPSRDCIRPKTSFRTFSSTLRPPLRRSRSP